MKPIARLIFGGLVLALSGCDTGPSPATEPAPAEHRSAVRVAEARLAQGADTLRLPGVVRAGQRAQPAFLHAGHLAERFVARGERVVAGQRLASLQNPALGPALAAAEAQQREIEEQLVQLEADYRRARELREQGLGSEESLDRALAQLKAARQARARALARVAEARDQLADAVLRAPFDGTVSDLLVEPGDFVRAGQPVMMLTGEALEVEVQLRPATAARMTVDDQAEILLKESGVRLSGHIRELGRGAPGAPVPVVIAIDPADSSAARQGAPVYAILELPAQSAASVPLAAVIDPGTGYGRVFRVAEGRAEQVSVQLGRLAEGWVEVFGPVTAGDRIVVAGQSNLLDGEPVRIVR